jgi:uncharacterized repeat protein (TIGR01451 family)
MVFDGAGRLFVSDSGDFGAGIVYEIDTAGTKIFNSFSLPFRGGAAAFDGTNLYVGDSDSSQVRVTDRSGMLNRTFDSHLRPAGIVFDPASGHLWVISSFDKKISEITTNGDLIRSCDGPRNPGVQGIGGLTMVGSKLYLSEVSDPDPFIPPEVPGTIYIVDPKVLMCSPSVSLTSLPFGEVVVGSTKDLTFTVTNTGGGTLTGTVTTSAPFSIISGSTFSLGAGASQAVIVRFSPTSSGSFGGVVNITSSGGSASVTLSGTGTALAGPALTVCGTTLDFGSVPVGSLPKNLTCTVTNTGTGTLTGTAATVPPFSIVSGTPFSLGAGQSGTLTLRFTPSSASPAEGVLSFSSNGGNPTITLRGTGTQGSVLAVSPTTVNFGGVRVGGNKDLTLSVQNTGGGTLTRTVCAPAPFSSTSGASFSLTAGQSQPLTVRFSPPSPGAFKGTVTFSATPCTPQPQTDPAVVTVSGMGEPAQASGRAYVVNRGSNSVSVIDTATQQVIKTIEVGTAPVALALTPDESKVYVVNRGSHNVSVITTATLQVTTTISVGFGPAAILITPTGQRAYVANRDEVPNGTVSVLNPTTDTLLDTLPAYRPFPSVLALSPAGTVLFVLGPGSRFVGVVDTTTNQVARIEIDDDPVAVAFSPDGRRAYIANQGGNTVVVLDITTFPPTKLTAVPVGQGPNSVVVSPDGHKVYVANPLDSSLSIIPTAATQTSSALSGWPVHVVDTPEGPLLVQAVTFAQWIVPWTLLIDPRSLIAPSSVAPPTPRLVVINRGSATTRAPGSVGFLDMGTEQALATVAVGTNSEQSAFDPELPQAIVTNLGSANISFVNTTTATAAAPLPVGIAPVAVAVALQTPEVPTAADLALTKTDSPDPVRVGSTLTYSITVTNTGPDPATGAIVTDTLSSGVTFVSSSASQGTCSGTSTVSCKLGTLAKGATARVTILVTPTAAGGIRNTARVTGTETDPTPATNAATAVTTVIRGCTYAIAPARHSFPARGGSGTVRVRAGGGCSWTAVSKTSWLTLTSGSSGTGNGTVTYTVAANTSTSSRTGTLTIAGKTFTVEQAGSRRR